jgi:hypothetical protein
MAHTSVSHDLILAGPEGRMLLPAFIANKTPKKYVAEKRRTTGAAMPFRRKAA